MRKAGLIVDGFEAGEIETLPKTEAALIDHLESEHHIAVRREGETQAQARARLIEKFPEADDPRTCKCPSCRAGRS